MTAKGFLQAAWPLIGLAVPLVIAALLIGSISPAMARVVADTLIKMIMVAGLYIFIGNSGVLSFGHGAFLIIGGYCSAWLTIPPTFKAVILPALPEVLRTAHFDPLLAGICAIGLAAIVAFLIGIPLMRLSGIAASIATFAFFIVVSVIYNNWTDWTKGTSSLVGLPVYVNHFVALACALLALLVAFVFQRSRYGLMLRATREDLVAARAAGIPAERLRILAWVVSAAVVAMGGVLWGHNNGALTTTNNLYLNLTFLATAMLVVGGVGSLSGVVLGTLLLSVLGEFLRRFEQGFPVGDAVLAIPGGSREVLLGLCLLLVLIFRPEGLSGGREFQLPKRLRVIPTREG